MARSPCYSILAGLLATLCGAAPGCFGSLAPGAGLGERQTLAGSATLRVLTFNIEWGGANVRFASVVEAIRASGAEIVAVQEAEGNLTRLAADLGWHCDVRSYVVSQHPIIDPPEGGGRYVYVEIRPGRVVAVANVHLPSDPYGPHWVRDGRSLEEVLDLERATRLPGIEPLLEVLPVLAGRGIPVFLAGDFNAPSHADWTEAASAKQRGLRYPVDWPVSRAVERAGFRDSFREAHPDPVAAPGLTWWAKRARIRDYNPGEAEPQDRIDFLWYAGPAAVTASEVVGEAGGTGVSIAVTPWPSDHRGVVSSFEVTPAPLPLLIAAERRLNHEGDPIRIVYNAPGVAEGVIAVAPVREVGAAAWREVGAIHPDRGGVEIPPSAVGEYQLALRDGTGATLSSNSFWVIDPSAVPAVEIVGSKFAAGEPLPIRWTNGPGNRNDWLAVFGADSPRDETALLAWTYVGARSAGALDLSAATAEAGWPLAPGRYVVRLLKDDGFEALAESAPFSVE